jgi:hypothetical protein
MVDPIKLSQCINERMAKGMPRQAAMIVCYAEQGIDIRDPAEGGKQDEKPEDVVGPPRPPPKEKETKPPKTNRCIDSWMAMGHTYQAAIAMCQMGLWPEGSGPEEQGGVPGGSGTTISGIGGGDLSGYVDALSDGAAVVFMLCMAARGTKMIPEALGAISRIS